MAASNNDRNQIEKKQWIWSQSMPTVPATYCMFSTVYLTHFPPVDIEAHRMPIFVPSHCTIPLITYLSPNDLNWLYAITKSSSDKKIVEKRRKFSTTKTMATFSCAIFVNRLCADRYWFFFYYEYERSQVIVNRQKVITWRISHQPMVLVNSGLTNQRKD